ncbi:hypothetical protein O9G_001487 [Rozella allomycis CSF55]|uniref:Plasma membrane fusion protein PRM1 n=1 Tax=Rozella allomycis (strain CSF55) TaxID=988480 RepID=A0A075AMV6_ROZAC|nr:hypothetical protein O9G_001487 [Rozella allomycis CSF55]|eukprot:EPZ31013.1 hypothetical protein O9G_001487 [Rozella allomycis CSF55]
MIMMPIIGLLFCCCRCCCNSCGGRKPRKGGYTTYQVASVSILLLILSGVVFFFGSFILIGSKQFTTNLSDASLIIQDTTNQINSVTDGLVTSADQLGSVINTGISGLADAVLATDFGVIIRQNLGPTVNNIFGVLGNMNIRVSNITSQINTIEMSIQNLSNTLNNITNITGDITTLLDNLRAITIDTQTYNVSGVPTISAFTLPNVSAIVDFSAISSPINNLPNINNLTTTLNNTYEGTISSLPSMLNSTIRNLTDTISSGGGLSSMTSGLGNQLRTATSPVTSQIATYKTLALDMINNLVLPYDTYRDIGFIALVGLVFLGFAFGTLAVLFQKGVIAEIMKPITIISSFCIWLCFILFFLMAFVFNAIAINRTSILTKEYSLGPAPNLNLFNATPASQMNISPATLLNSCLSGKSIFNASVISNGTTLVAYLGLQNFFIDQLNKTKGETFIEFLNLDSQFANINVDNAVSFTLPDLSELNSISNVNLSAISSFSVNVSLPIDIQSTIDTLTGVSNNLTLSTLISGWDPTQITSNLTSFNTLAQSVNGSFVPFTETYIVNTYINGGSTFDASQITGSSSDANNNALNVTFYAAYGLIRVNYSASIVLPAAKNNIGTIQTDLVLLNHTLNNVDSNVSNITTRLSDLVNFINNTLPILNSINSTVSAVSPALNVTLVAAKNAVILSVKNSVANLYDQMISILNHAGECKGIANVVVEILNYLSVNWAQTMNLLWVCYFFIGICLFIGFIVGVKAAKRLGVKNKIHPGKDKTEPLEKVTLLEKKSKK